MTKTVLITGCSSGIGATLAKTMHQSGYHVYASARNAAKLAPLRDMGIQTLTLDVTQASSITQALNTISADQRTVDILVNNAGYGAMGPLIEMPRTELNQQFETNVYGPLALIQAVAPGMIKQKTGLIINVGSVSGVLVTPFSGAYCATKAALHALSDALRMELAPFNIQVMTVQPGAIESEFGTNAEASLDRTLASNSMYQNIENYIVKRAQASQNSPTTAQALVDELMNHLKSNHPPSTVRIGKGSFVLPIMARVLPYKITDTLLKRAFGLSSAKLNAVPEQKK